MTLLSLYYQNCASDFDDFAQMLEIVALNDLASVLCARKFLLFYYLFIIIFKALKLVAAVF